MDAIDRFRDHPWVLRTYVVLLVVVPLGATLFALTAFSRYEGNLRDVALFTTFSVLTSLGVTIGYHRLLTHQSFECHPVLKALLVALGCMAIQGNPLRWVATHIRHHAHADKDEDPHSPMGGLLHAHVGWLMKPAAFADTRTYAPFLQSDRIALFFDRSYTVWFAASFLLPAAIGGWSGLLWGGLVRVFFTTHVTWSVNSICHMFGRRPFRTGDTSANNWIVGLLGFGEGWHNNHHAFPQSAFHGLRAWQIDLSGYLIWLFSRLRLAWNTHRPSPALVATKMAKPIHTPPSTATAA